MGTIHDFGNDLITNSEGKGCHHKVEEQTFVKQTVVTLVSQAGAIWSHTTSGEQIRISTDNQKEDKNTLKCASKRAT